MPAAQGRQQTTSEKDPETRQGHGQCRADRQTTSVSGEMSAGLGAHMKVLIYNLNHRPSVRGDGLEPRKVRSMLGANRLQGCSQKLGPVHPHTWGYATTSRA